MDIDGRVNSGTIFAALCHNPATREHLSPRKDWALLDVGDRKVQKLFPEAIISTGLNIALRTASIKIHGRNPGDGFPFPVLVTLEEPLDDFPSEHMIAQLMLVLG